MFGKGSEFGAGEGLEGTVEFGRGCGKVSVNLKGRAVSTYEDRWLL